MSDEPPRANEENGLRGSEPIYLLTRDKNNRAGQEKYHLHEAHMSCVVYGSDEWQWTAWAFEDTEHEPEDDNDVDISATIAGDELCQDINEDPIIIGHHANKPIWKPRQYFLKAFETRIKKVGEEWGNLDRKLEVDQREYVCLLLKQIFFFHCLRYMVQRTDFEPRQDYTLSRHHLRLVAVKEEGKRCKCLLIGLDRGEIY